MSRDIELARRYVSEARNILVFTGPRLDMSGVSPVFEYDAEERVVSPVSYDDFCRSTLSKLIYWRYAEKRYGGFFPAAPKACHMIFAELEKRGKLYALVTLSGDSMHRASGIYTDRLVELHGTMLYAECTDCYDWSDIREAFAEFSRTGAPPQCGTCGGWLRPGLLLPGEAPDLCELRRAFSRAEKCDLAISAGTVLSESVSALVPLAVKAGGGRYITVNDTETAHDRYADISLKGPLMEILQGIIS